MSPRVRPVTKNPKELGVFLGALNTSEAHAVSDFMPQLIRELQSEWPVRGYYFRKRNPYKPDGTETAIVLLLVSPLLSALGNQLRDVVMHRVRLLLSGMRRRARAKVRKKSSRKRVVERRPRPAGK